MKFKNSKSKGEQMKIELIIPARQGNNERCSIFFRKNGTDVMAKILTEIKCNNGDVCVFLELDEPNKFLQLLKENSKNRETIIL